MSVPTEKYSDAVDHNNKYWIKINFTYIIICVQTKTNSNPVSRGRSLDECIKLDGNDGKLLGCCGGELL